MSTVSSPHLPALRERFQHLFEDALIDELAAVGSIKTFEKDTVLMDIGQTIDQMPLVLSGSVKIMTEDQEGSELLLYYLELGDTCAVTLNCCSKKSKSTIRAITETDCELLFVPINHMDTWMATYKGWRNFVLESYHGRMNEMLEAIDTLVFHNMEERLHKYLRDKVMVTGSAVLDITHAQIAHDMHSSRVVISRLMKKLDIDGKVKHHRNRVELVEFL